MQRLISAAPIRRLIVAAGATALATAGLMVTGVGVGTADPGGSGCQVEGNAVFSPGPGAHEDQISYTLTGTLSTCQTSRESAPAGGTIGVGQTVQDEPVELTLPDGTVVPGTADYKALAATGSSSGGLPNSCVSSETSGTAIIDWEGGGITVVEYTTNSLASGVGLQGSVVPSVVLTLVAGSASVPGAAAPETIEVSTDTFAGESAVGVLRFSPPDPTECTVETGVSEAGISGVVGVGTQS